MSAKRVLLLVLVASAFVLAVGAGPGTPGVVRALPPAQAPDPAGRTIPYTGTLTGEAGEPVADGAYAFSFALYATESGSEALWVEVQEGVLVQGGAFAALLGSTAPLSKEALEGGLRWLAVGVRGPGEAAFTALSPRQKLSTTTAPAAASPASGAACPHNHLSEYWVGFSTTNDGLRVENTKPEGNGLVGLAPNGANAWAVLGSSEPGIGVRGNSASGTGVWGKANSGNGVHGQSDTGNGVYAEGRGSGNTHAALRANNTGNGLAAYLTNNSAFPTLEIDKTGSGGAAIDLQLFNPGNMDPAMFIKGYDENAVLQFLISTNGIVAANGYIDWRRDIAEMLPAAQELEPGDVLAIGPDGNLIRATEPYQTSVAGVYSSDPAFMFGHPLEGKTPGTIPLAMSGVVPVKVSAENGSIHPGDLLVASATAGYAMRAGPNPPQGTVIGKALETWDAGTGTIEMLATLQ